MKRFIKAALSCNSVADILLRRCRPPESPDGWRYKPSLWPRDVVDREAYSMTWWEQGGADLRYVSIQPVEGGWRVSAGAKRSDFEQRLEACVGFDEAVAVARDAMEAIGPGTTMQEAITASRVPQVQ